MLLASTAIVALLGGCQSSSGDLFSSTPATAGTAVSPGFGGYAW